MELLNFLEFLASFPAECWLIPPILMVGAVLAVAIARRASLLGAWGAVARRLGLKLNRTNLFNSPIIHGDYQGRDTQIIVISRRDSFFRRDGTRVEMKLENPEMVRMRFWKQDAVDTLFKVVGMKDVQVGDAAFDRHFFIHCNEPEPARAIFADEALRGDLVRSGLYEVELSTHRMFCTVRHVERDPARMEALLDVLAALAGRIDGLKIDYKPEIIRT